MHTFLDNFHQSGKYSAQLASHQVNLRREEKFPDQKCLNISSLQTDYLNLENIFSGLVDIMRDHTLSRQSAHFVDLITILRKKIQKDQTGKGESSRGWCFI